MVCTFKMICSLVMLDRDLAKHADSESSKNALKEFATKETSRKRPARLTFYDAKGVLQAPASRRKPLNLSIFY